MKKLRILAAASIAAMSALTLAGCFQLPSPNVGTSTTPAVDADSDQALRDSLAGTTWSGEMVSESGDFFVDLVFELEADGTVIFTTWNDEGPYDSPSDTWSVEGGQLLLHVSDIQDVEYIDFTGPASATGSMSLTGVDGNGLGGYTLPLTAS